MLRIVTLFLLLSISVAGYAQETVELSNTIAPGITEKYHVLKSNTNIKQGLYQALYKRKNALATGMYNVGKRVGIWHFYGNDGKLVQHYNYDSRRLVFVANEDSSRNITAFDFIPKLIETDTVRLPVKVGGLFYGYLPFLSKFKVKDAGNYEPGSLFGILQILVTPFGQIAECKLTVKYEILYNMVPTDRVLDDYFLNNDLLTADEREFVPATVNSKAVSTTIYIYCKVHPNGKVTMY